MTFLWPQYLWLLLAVPLLVLAYLALLRRRTASAVRFSNLAMVRAAQSPSWRRHLPPALLLLACGMLLLATARPVASIALPWTRSTIILAIDVSLSMRVTDVKPSRMIAAQEAAKAFLQDLPRSVEVGLVTFAGTAHVAQAATLDREALVTAINGFQMQRGTAIGSAIVLSLAELFPDHGIDLVRLGDTRARGRSLDEAQNGASKPPPKVITPVAPGSYESAAIILLSDGRRTTGIDTLEAAKMAADRGVRVYVVGLGTVEGAAEFGDSMAIYLRLDEPALRAVAHATGGEYHHAGGADKLRSVYESLGSRLQVHKRETELSGPIAALAALLSLVAASLSLMWFGRVA